MLTGSDINESDIAAFWHLICYFLFIRVVKLPKKSYNEVIEYTCNNERSE